MSNLELMLEFHIKAAGLPEPETEYVFHQHRKTEKWDFVGHSERGTYCFHTEREAQNFINLIEFDSKKAHRIISDGSRPLNIERVWNPNDPR